jgi:hypothetical protein
MNLLIFIIVVFVVIGILFAIMNYIPLPAPLAWMKWAVPVVALLFALILILQRSGMLTS